MQNSLNKDANVVEFSSTKSSSMTDVMKDSGVVNKEFALKSFLFTITYSIAYVILGKMDLSSFAYDAKGTDVILPVKTESIIVINEEPVYEPLETSEYGCCTNPPTPSPYETRWASFSQSVNVTCQFLVLAFPKLPEP